MRFFSKIQFAFTALILSAATPGKLSAGDESWHDLPIRALLMSPPSPGHVPEFCQFIRDALPKEGVNTLVVRFEYQYKFKSHPELADEGALSRDEVKQIVLACRDASVTLVPCMNLLAHQSEHEKILPLLAKYPQFDESPDYNPPHPWKDGGQFDFYTKCLCPRHPDLFNVIFPLMDELVDACEADALHVGLDEAWIVAYPKCPRCGGGDPAEIFAQYVTKLHDHLAEKHCRMWMWSDRLIDGKTSGLLAWQASMNNTWRAIDLIPKDILICDWKYEDAPPTPSYLAIKGFDVLASPCYKSDEALAQLEQVYQVRKNGAREDFSKVISSRMKGVFETSWMSSESFIGAYYSTNSAGNDLPRRTTDTFKALFAEIRRNDKAAK